MENLPKGTPTCQLDRLHCLAGFPGCPCGASVVFTGLDADEQVLGVEYTPSLSDDIIDDILNH